MAENFCWSVLAVSLRQTTETVTSSGINVISTWYNLAAVTKI